MHLQLGDASGEVRSIGAELDVRLEWVAHGDQLVFPLEDFTLLGHAAPELPIACRPARTTADRRRQVGPELRDVLPRARPVRVAPGRSRSLGVASAGNAATAVETAGAA